MKGSVTVLVAAVLASAQQGPTFEAASIKPGTGNSGLHNPDCSGQRFSVGGLRFGYLLQWAYDLQGTAARDAFLERVPLSIRQTTYEIQAKAEVPFASESECRLMVQTLLADRFKLSVHY